MLAQGVTFFSVSLFLFLFLTTHSAEQSSKEVPFLSHPLLTREQRNKVIGKSLASYKEVVSEELRQDIVKATEHYDRSRICDLMLSIMRSRPGTSSFEETCRSILTREERYKTVKNIVSLHDQSIVGLSIQNMVEQTAGYNTLQLSAFIFDTIKESAFTQEVNLKGAAYRFVRRQQQASRNQPMPYPMLKDVFHPDKVLFKEIARQLRFGKFSKEFSRGILLYGPPGNGKNEMIKAIANESGCHISNVVASELVTDEQGSGSRLTKEIFDRARRENPNKGVIIVINELQNITPITTDQSVPIAHIRSGQEYNNALTQLCAEYDRCVDNNNDNILVVITCNQFYRIDERIRGRFECIEFPCPDENGIYEILKNKSEYFGILLSEAEIAHYAKKLKGLSGRDITNFVQNAKREISLGKTKEEALALAMKNQIRAARDARENSNRMFQQLSNEAARGAIFGLGSDLAKGLLAGIIVVVGIGFKMLSESNNSNKGTSSHK